MPETFLHGVTITEIDTGSRPIRVAATSIIGVVGTGGGTVTDFPLDTPVLVNKASQLASVTGYLKDAIDAIVNATAKGDYTTSQGVAGGSVSGSLGGGANKPPPTLGSTSSISSSVCEMSLSAMLSFARRASLMIGTRSMV